MKRIGSIGLLLALSAKASAQDAPVDATQVVDPETIIIIDRAPDPDAAPETRDRDRALGDAPFVTIVHADDHPGTTSVADAVGVTVGVQSRSLGGLGAYESISVRGASPGHTVVLVDGVPLARLAAVTTDLGRYSLDAFSEVELYRGAVPVELGGAGVGGALNLVTRLGRGEHGERITASLGAGSFGARHVRARYGDRHLAGKLESATTVGYQAAAGDYTFFSDNGTPLNKSDDGYEVRKNNQFSQVDAASRVGRADRSAIGGVRLAWKKQGLPGSATQPSLSASMTTLDVIGDTRFDLHAGSAVARQLAYALVEMQHLDDPAGELGLGTQERGYLTLSGGASSTWHAPIGAHGLTAGVELRGDRFTDRDRSAMRAAFIGDREGASALAAIDFNLDPTLVVTPAVRVDLVRTAPTPMGSGPTAGQPVETRRDAVPSPRLSARAAVTENVSIKTSAGWYVRLPTLVELFGNRGTILGSPDLLPERGPSADVGVVWAPSRAIDEFDRILVEASAFGTRSHDTIAFINSSGFITRAMNLANTQTYGAEFVASFRFARAVSFTGNYTRLVTQQLTAEPSYADKAIPREPAHALYGRADFGHRVLGHHTTLWLDASWQSATYLDQANLMMVPERVLVGTGARIEIAGNVAASLAIENLADTRIQELPLDPPPRPDLTTTPTALADVAGFPLPGRTFYVSLDWSH
jgi:vitamin B12 transporter